MPPKPRRAAGRGAGRGAARLRWHPAPRRPGAPHRAAQDFAPRQRSSSASSPPRPSDPSDRCCEPKALAEPRTVHHPGAPGATQDPTAPHGHPGPDSTRTVPWAVPRSREPRALQHPVKPLSSPGSRRAAAPRAPHLTPHHTRRPRSRTALAAVTPGNGPLPPPVVSLLGPPRIQTGAGFRGNCITAAPPRPAPPAGTGGSRHRQRQRHRSAGSAGSRGGGGDARRPGGTGE